MPIFLRCGVRNNPRGDCGEPLMFLPPRGENLWSHGLSVRAPSRSYDPCAVGAEVAGRRESVAAELERSSGRHTKD